SEHCADLLRSHSLLAQTAKTERIMSLGQTLACRVMHERAMKIFRRRVSECALEKDLPRRRLQEVSTTHDFSDLHGGIVHDAGKLVGGDLVAPPHQEIPEIAADDETLLPQRKIVEGDGLVIRDTKSPIRFTW